MKRTMYGVFQTCKMLGEVIKLHLQNPICTLEEMDKKISPASGKDFQTDISDDVICSISPKSKICDRNVHICKYCIICLNSPASLEIATKSPIHNNKIEESKVQP